MGANLFTIGELCLRAADAREVIRARDILAKGKFRMVSLEGGLMKAEVKGTDGLYDLELGANLKGYCACMAWRKSKKREFCKHLAAAGLLWLEREGVAMPTVAELDPELSAAITALSEAQLRDLLAEAAGQSLDLHRRILSGEWRSD